MAKAETLKRIEAVIERGQRTLDSVDPITPTQIKMHFDPGHRWVKEELASAFRTAGLTLLERLYGTGHQVYKDFAGATNGTHTLSSYKRAHAIICTVRDEFAQSGATDFVGISFGKASTETTQGVFLVHGHDEGARESVARYLERLGIKPIILHEQPSRGRTVIEKLEHHADVTFAVVLLTPDDVGADHNKAAKLAARARQNVVMELGFFLGRLGRQRVCALHRGPLELPSDYMGVVYVQLDDGGGWKLELARELAGAGFNVDMNLAIEKPRRST